MARVSRRQDVGLKERGAATPLGAQELYRRIPEDTVLVVYAVVDDRLVTWLVRRGGIETSWEQPAWPLVSSTIQGLRQLKEGLEANRQALMALYQQLVAPWIRELQAGNRIIFVPTSSLYRVPFAALVDPESGRFLIQDYALGVAPSASQFIAALGRDRQISGRPLRSVLLVGNPAISVSENPSLPSLTGSILEIDQLEEIYRDLCLRVLTREEAAPVQVLSAIRQSDVAHFSVHSIADRDDPRGSHLVLAPDPTGEEISTRTVLALRLPRTRLVVLAACGTHAGPVSASEGALSLSAAFLAAGVPAVLGSLWPVADASTARLSILFHQELRRGADPVTALRAAQLAEIAQERGWSDGTWASFQLFGGVVSAGRAANSRQFAAHSPRGAVPLRKFSAPKRLRAAN
jgi:CHAT domain-containing protein